MRLILFTATVLAVAGCEKAPPPRQVETVTNQAADQSTASSTIGTMLQYDTMKAGQRTQDKARKVTATINERSSTSATDDM